MPFTLIQGTFKPDTGRPDGDTVRFAPDNSMLVFLLERRGRPPKLNQDNGTTSLRYEGIDAMEKSARKPESSNATDKNLELLGITEDARETRGYILSNQLGPYGRPISFIFTGEPEEEDGTSIFLKPDRIKTSLNYQLIANGNAYPLYYDTLFFDLRQELTAAVQTARNADRGIWQDDASTDGATWGGADSLYTLSPLFPKLWRRLEAYTQDRDFRDDSDNLARFLEYIVSKRSERVLILSEGRLTGFDNVIEVEENQIKLLYQPEDLVFMS